MKILFLDQSGKPGGAELCLIDIAKPYGDRALVGLFADGDFRKLLQQHHIPVKVLATQAIQVGKQSNLLQSLASVGQLAPLLAKVVQTAKEYDVIYANTQKALVIGALASFLARRPLVYHLHDILSLEHFSQTNLRIAVTLANRFASLVIANSQASQTAFIQAGGNAKLTEIVYNGFECQNYQTSASEVKELQQQLGLEGKFVVGHFSRLAPWKGQHILIAALSQCPPEVTVILVGDALFGEQDYVQQLHEQVAQLKLENRVKFLGFRADVPQLMAACNLVAHTSTAPEPFGRVIVEAMLCGRPVVAAQAGGAMELVEHGVNGFLVKPGEIAELAQVINTCVAETAMIATMANHGRAIARQRFDIIAINHQIAQLLNQLSVNSYQ
ncbi:MULTISPECIES: glycosyltransferase family 4 protein [Cyanophyceae]|uniref:glycosyltransferase family 4 protein n=1 Tax=Cyanophyceae TaxID=3028117 RepID=UPI00232DDBD6|nr:MULTISPECIES: glycosyltransferase family 4 protein [Cyanophyceae]MDB9354667.1 glycosyltransferase family 4 protein [Nodularia spumigena CS-587/03]MDB9340547.1 glycosyltransferase family 4 protein [Nodularia spumigena CS-589/07]MDB9399491.1 glycosyltransferase family 4 protein [Microcystis aeruginosa CS-567/02-A1]MDB9498481.1 glycosyltransferase family 4 protein [Nodularia spumigena CS-336/02]MDB9530603.1 glycosyltransferase family 4 protein [Nodularia spumigena CS-1038]